MRNSSKTLKPSQGADIAGLAADYLKKLGVKSVERLKLPSDTYDFVKECVSTLDEAAAGQGEVIKRLPDWPFIRDVIRALASKRWLRIDKSGQVLVSWICVASYLHRVLTTRGYRLGYYCQTMTKAQRHVESRFWRMYSLIPASFNTPYAACIGGQFIVYHDGRDKPATAWVTPMASEEKQIDGAADKMRSETWSHALIDEGAFMRNLKELIASLEGRTQGITVVSTPNGHEFFWQLGFGDIQVDIFKDQGVESGEVSMEGLWPNASAVGATIIRLGVWEWKHNNWSHLRIHDSARPDRVPGSLGYIELEARRARTPAREWRREHQISYDIEAGQPVFVDTERIGVIDQIIQPWLPVIRGHDYSFLASVCLFTQIRQQPDGRHKLHILREIVSTESTIAKHGTAIIELSNEVFPKMAFRDYGDYSANQRSSTGTIYEEMRKLGIILVTVPTGPGGVLKNTELVQKLISDGLLEVDPESCPMLLKALKSSLTRDDNGEPIDEHPWRDCVDALFYLVANTFELHNLPSGGQVVNVKDQFRGSGTQRAATQTKPWHCNMPFEPSDVQNTGTVIRDESQWRGSGRSRRGDDGGGPVFRG